MTTITLEKPIQFGKEMITQLSFRDAKAKDIRQRAEQLNTNELLNLAQDLSGQPKYVMDELSITDMYEVLSLMGKLLENGKAIGGKP